MRENGAAMHASLNAWTFLSSEKHGLSRPQESSDLPPWPGTASGQAWESTCVQPGLGLGEAAGSSGKGLPINPATLRARPRVLTVLELSMSLLPELWPAGHLWLGRGSFHTGGWRGIGKACLGHF